MENGPYGNIYIIILSIVGTIVIMIISAMYTIRNIKRVWCLGSVKKKRSANKEKNNEKKEQQQANVGSSNKEKRKDAKRSSVVDKEECVATANSKNGSKSSSEDLFETNEAVKETPDPVQYYHHIPSEVKKARQRVAIRNIKSQLTKEELEEEKAVQRQQLQEMFDLMKSQGDKFGLTDSEMEKQMQLYSI